MMVASSGDMGIPLSFRIWMIIVAVAPVFFIISRSPFMSSLEGGW